MYIKGDNEGTNYSYKKIYVKTDKDIRLKHPVWAIILFLFSFIVPVLNLIVFIVYLLQMTLDSDGSEYCRYYCKSFFNKEY